MLSSYRASARRPWNGAVGGEAVPWVTARVACAAAMTSQRAGCSTRRGGGSGGRTRQSGARATHAVWIGLSGTEPPRSTAPVGVVTMLDTEDDHRTLGVVDAVQDSERPTTRGMNPNEVVT